MGNWRFRVTWLGKVVLQRKQRFVKHRFGGHMVDDYFWRDAKAKELADYKKDLPT